MNFDYSNIDAILVDCFDTIIYRKCSDEEIFELWFQDIARLCRIDSSIVSRIWNEVLSSKREDISNIKDEICFSDYIFSLYNRLGIIINHELDFPSFYEKLLNQMIALEINNDFINKKLLESLVPALKLNIPIYCVSDFYLPKIALEKLFESLNIRYIFNEVYVSAEVGYRKSTGKLYEHIISKLNISPNRLMMIGDNKESDINIPKGIGLRTYHIKSMKYACMTSVYNKYLEVYNNSLKNEAPLAIYSFTLFQFCQKIHDYIISNGISKIYFLSREGEFLKKLFEKYLLMIKENTINTRYLYISRKSTYLPSLDSLDKEVFHIVRKSYNKLSIRQFLSIINLESILDIHTEFIDRYDVNLVVSNFWNSEIFYNFIKEKFFIKYYEECRIAAKSEIIDYFAQQEIDDVSDLCIVDIGWKGTIQDNISRIFPNKKITGLYYGLQGSVDMSKSNLKIGLIYSSIPFPSCSFDLLSINSRVLERILYASHGSCLRYKDGQAVLDKIDVKEYELFNFIKHTQDIIYKNFDKIYELLIEENVNSKLFCECVLKLYANYLCNASKQKYQQLSYINRRQKMSEGDYNISVGIKYKILLMLKLIKRKRYVELCNKIQSQLVDANLYISAKIIGILFMAALIKPNKNF